jgi:hypothetical protein
VSIAGQAAESGRAQQRTPTAPPRAEAAPAVQPESAQSAGSAVVGFAGAGDPLPGPSSTWLALVLGAPPPDVRIHNDRPAAALARAESALAVTRGADIAFAAGAYRPGTPAGDVLLAHEVAHAMQQSGGVAAAGDQARADRGHEREADLVAYRAALAIFDPAQAARLAPARVTFGAPLRLARCAMPEPPDLQGLPSREEYERQGRLLPRMFGSLDEPPPGVQILQLGPREPEPVDPFAPVPESLGSKTVELPVDELLTRLSAIDFRQRRIDELSKDLDGGVDVEIAHMSILFARSTVERPHAQILVLGPPLDPRLMVRQDRAGMTREIVRADVVQRRVHAALVDLNGQRSAEQAEGSQLKDYDVAPAIAKIDGVRRLYRDAASVVLAPVQVERLNTAIRQHRGLNSELMSLKLGHFEQRAATGAEIQDAIHEVNSWASELRTDLEVLKNEADAAAAARDARSPDAPRLRTGVARHAQLISLGIEALGEWESAIRAYEELHDSPARGWGGKAIQQVAFRLGQMHTAYQDRDTDYLRLLVRDHQGDPQIIEFYKEVPQAIAWSKMAVGFAVMVIAAIATAGVGILVETAAVGVLGLAETSYIVIGAKMAAEAVTFTLVSRAMLSAIPGMAPESSVWADLIWNLALFGVLRAANTAMKAALLLEKASVLVTAMSLRATEFAVLEFYGVARFAWENRSRDALMSGEQFAVMSAQNVVMMAGMAVAMKPVEPIMKSFSKGSLGYFRGRYGDAFVKFEAQREALTQEVATAVERQGPPDPKAVDHVKEQGRGLNDDLMTLVDTAVSDPKVDAAGLQRELSGVRSEVAATPVDDLLSQGGLDLSVDVRTGGDGASASYAAGKTEPLITFLRGQGHAVREVVERPDGTHVFEANIAAKGDVVFSERPARDPSQLQSRPPRRRIVMSQAKRAGRTSEASKPADPAEATAEGDATSAQPEPLQVQSPEQEALLDQIQRLRGRIYRLRARTKGLSGVDAGARDASKVWLDQLSEIAARVRLAGGDVPLLEREQIQLEEIAESIITNIRGVRPVTRVDVETFAARMRRRSLSPNTGKTFAFGLASWRIGRSGSPRGWAPTRRLTRATTSTSSVASRTRSRARTTRSGSTSRTRRPSARCSRTSRLGRARSSGSRAGAGCARRCSINSRRPRKSL